MRFPVVVHKDEGTSYGVTVPDLQGCISAGDTLDEAFENAKKAIKLHTEGMLADGESLPELKSVEEHVRGEFAEDYEGGVWGYVDVGLDDAPRDVAVRVSVTIPSRVLAKIDHQARREGETRSGFLARAALDRIAMAPEGDS